MENEGTKIAECGREPSQASEQQPQQQPNDVDTHGQGETTESTKTRGDGDASARTNTEHLSNTDRAAAEQATNTTELSKTRVHDAWVLGAGELVRVWRTELGLSRHRLAHELGYSESQVFYWESNREHIALKDLQQLSRMAGKDLEQALRSLQSPESQDIAIKWKGAAYSIDAFIESTRNPCARVDYSQAQQTFYLKLDPMTNVEFHRRDIITALLEKDGVQAIAVLTVVKGTRANIKKADIENLGIKTGDKVNVHVLNVRGPGEPPWTHGIQVTPTTTSGETRIQLTEKLEELGLKVRDGDYASIAIQTQQGKILATGQIENKAIRLSEDATEKLLTTARRGEAQTLTVRTDGIALSPRPFTEKTHPPPKPREKTTFKLEGKAITIEYQNQEYKITTIEAEKVGNLHLYRYKTRQGEETLHIPTENKTIPPYETPWYALPQTIAIYLDKEYKHELLHAAINKAGGKTQLRNELRKRETQIAIKYLNDQLSERMDGMVANKLIPILRYLGRDLDEPNHHTAAIGNARAIKNPKLPFNLRTPHGARIMAARYSDGSIHTPKRAGPRFEYTNKDDEQRRRIAESLRNIFGDPNITDRIFDDGRIPRLRATTDIVGHTLQRSGAVTGRIILQNPDIPAFIRQGSPEMKREWLVQAFGDEGSPSTHCGIITLERAIDGTHNLSVEQRNRLDIMSEQWKRKTRKADLHKKGVKYYMFKDLPQDIQETLDSIRPQILESEARILTGDFGIGFNERPKEIYKREGGYGVLWALQIGAKEAIKTFYSEIGFPQKRKQERLKNMLKNSKTSSR
ncbi:MAG: helix-turn-helix transcriptional regulator [Promethearchaeati archaeon SRVP18_Atabeyarchaeia-1]